MKSEGVHITLCCEHCSERVAMSQGNFNCPHCGKRCKSNTDVAGALMRIAEQIQAMPPEEFAAIVEDMEPARQVKCEACNGSGRITTTLVATKKTPARTLSAMCRECYGKGKVTDEKAK